VTALVDVVLDFDADSEGFSSVPVDNNHEWDDESPMLCGHCGRSGIVDEFHIDPDDDDEPQEEVPL
jgi:hypothetical protein